MKKRDSKHLFFGSSTVGERGQITLPKDAREKFNINPGDKILIFGDLSKGLGLIKASQLKGLAKKLFESFDMENGGK